MMYWAYKDLIDTEDQQKHDPFNFCKSEHDL